MKNVTHRICVLLIAASMNMVVFAQEAPLINLKFNEGSGNAPVNAGSLAATFTRSAGTPASSANVPTGVGGSGAFDFGTTPGNYYVESTAALEGLKNLSGFTITGWVNSKSNVAGGGGNRIVSWINNGGDGVDLVYQSNGSLRLGVDGWPDNSPAQSSAGKIVANASAPASNWTFFAVTYLSNGQVQFYFGNNAADATLDVTRSYPGPGITGSNINRLAVGAFNIGTRNAGTYDRMFKGLIDDIQIHRFVLTPATIVAVQRGTTVDLTPPTQVTHFKSTSKTSTSISLSWEPSTDNVALLGYEIYNGSTLMAAIGQVTTYTLINLTPNTQYLLSIQAKDVAGNVSQGSAPPLTVVTGTPSPVIFLNFDESSGVTTISNNGTAGGNFVRTVPTPATSPNVPANVGGSGALDFGITPGNFYVESGAPIDQLKNLSAMTITGWINNKSNVVGSGGNRILSWINNGGDGVELVYQNNGSLRLGVDGWPDTSPAFSSANKIPTNTSGAADNWTFFAVTYQSNGQVQFYFGSNAADATLDATRSYPGPGVTGSNINRLAIGAFNIGTRAPSSYDRMFRGLIDDIKVYNAVLDVNAIRAVQRGGGGGPDATPPSSPQQFTVTDRNATSVSLSWNPSTDNVGVTEYKIYEHETLVSTVSAPATVATLPSVNGQGYTLTVKAADAAGNLSEASNHVFFIGLPTNSISNAIVDLKMETISVNEGVSSATSFYNFGSTGGPSLSSNAPTGVGLQRSLDFGTNPVNQGLRAMGPIGMLDRMGSFTVSGWLNNKSSSTGANGNTILSWSGVDLVYQTDGSLKLAVNEPMSTSNALSSPNKVSTDPNALASNWVFFAITYQASGQVKFYFGNNATDATLDLERSYPKGVTLENDPLFIGVPNPGSQSSGPSDYLGMFRGLMDNIMVYGYALSPAEIVAIQRGNYADVTPPTAPTNTAIHNVTSTSIELSWTASTDNIKVVEYSVYNGSTFLEAQSGNFTSAFLHRLQSGTTYNLTVKARDAAGNYSAAGNVVTATTKPSTPLFAQRFDEPEASYLGSQFMGGVRSTNTPPRIGAPFSNDGGAFQNLTTTMFSGKEKVTITGWLNCRASTTDSFGKPVFVWGDGSNFGINLVQQSDGSLRLGINEFAANSPAVSTASKVTIDPAAGANNWTFFAATYDASGQVQFYFGNSTLDAALDVTTSYPGRGALAAINGAIGIGRYHAGFTPAATNAMFSGLIDNFFVYDRVLTLAEIIRVQRGPDDNVAPTPPAGLSLESKGLTSAALTWSDGGTDNVRVTSREIYDGDTYVKSHYHSAKNQHLNSFISVTGLTPGATYNFNLRNRDANGNLSAPSNTVVVTMDVNTVGSPLIYLNLDRVSGYIVGNLGSAPATFYQSPSGIPYGSTNVPVGVGGQGAADFGTIPGDYYVESGAPIDALKNLNAFTLTGWVNNRSNVTGSGGNRIISWINHGGNGVDLVYQSDGSLRLGVDGWPDNSPAFSSPNKVPTSAAAPASNWTFFAVTYQSNGQVQFYFGNNALDASLDVTKTYTAPGVTGPTIGKLAIGAFNDATRTAGTYDRMFRGMIDDIYVYGSVLTPQEIVQVQRIANGNARSMSVARVPEPLIASEEPEMETQMFQNFPNPFGGTTNIEMYIKPTVRVARVEVIDMTGRLHQNIEVHGRGKTSVTVSSDNMAMGVYMYSFIADGKVITSKRMAVAK